jgi:hypothetical protein
MRPPFQLFLLFLHLATTSPIPIINLILIDYAYNSISIEIVDNTPLLPPKHTPATIALTASRPLASSYILSLSSPLPTLSKDLEAALLAKPTSALGDLRKEDMRQYWESLQSPAQVVPSKGSNIQEGSRMGGYLGRKYTDSSAPESHGWLSFLKDFQRGIAKHWTKGCYY